MFRNLRAEMAREGMSGKDVSTKIGISNKAFRNKMNGISEFTRKEMFKIQEFLFRDLTLEYLFYWDNHNPC